MSVITIPRVLREKLGEDATEALVEVFNKVEPDTAKIKAELSKELVTKADLFEESGKLRLEIEKLRVEVANVKADIIKWMFLFWIGQTAVTVALFKFFVK
ncbi:LA_3696 family protein [Candidatus Magnetominusculus dajiuhuensis]|uniref:LA_3696 family protein n=1 Tax=Candidatus Magnetominusculus dajiuhuensis TaxID=3137712 RepID=UPI003B43CBEB